MVFRTYNNTYTIYFSTINKHSFTETKNCQTFEIRETHHHKQRVANELLAGGGFFAENFYLVPMQEFLIDINVFGLGVVLGGAFAVVCQLDIRFGVNGITERTGRNRIAFLHLIRIRYHVGMVVERIGDYLMLVPNRIIEAELRFNRFGMT